MMKKVFSILIALVIFLSVMHISIAVHFCHGDIAEVKVSLSGDLGTCGMENGPDDKSLPAGFSKHCCDDELSVFTIEDYYSQDNNQPKTLLQSHLVAPCVFPSELVSVSRMQLSEIYSIRPPGNDFIHSVNLPFICVFRN
jgi:hypothetical protein